MHPSVHHPNEVVTKRKISRFNNFVTNHLALMLGSVVGMYLALAIPLLAIGIPILFKVEVIVFSSWIQSWGLFCLQRTANRADAMREAKADVDHEALTHIATQVDKIVGST